LVVRCRNCGTENGEDAQYCVECGVALRPSRARGEKHEKHEKAETDACFRPTRATRLFWLFVGLLIVLWGATELLRVIYNITVELWPLIAIALGLYIIYRVLSRSQRR